MQKKSQDGWRHVELIWVYIHLALLSPMMGLSHKCLRLKQYQLFATGISSTEVDALAAPECSALGDRAAGLPFYLIGHLQHC
jgi:hypothetical protein